MNGTTPNPGNNTNTNTNTNTPGDYESDLDLLNKVDLEKPEKGKEKAGTDNKEDDTDEIDIDLGTDDNDEDLDENEEDKETEDENVENLEDEDEETKEKDDEDNKALSNRPTLTDIKTKYPNIFKEYPELRQVLFREAKYSEVFPTVKEAGIAANRSAILSNIEKDLFSGEVEPLLKELKKSEESFQQIAYNVLPAIQKLDKNLYLEILKPVLKQLTRNIYTIGRGKNDKNLMGTAVLLHEFVFEDRDLSKDYDIPVKKSKEADPEKEQFEKQKREFSEQQFKTALNDVNSRVDRRLEKAIHKSLEDLGDNVTPFLKENITSKIIKLTKEKLTGDRNHTTNMMSLWQQADKAGFSEDSKVRILTAFLTRAKSILPAIRKEVVKEAFGKGEKAGRKPLPKRVVSSSQKTSANNVKSGKPDWSKSDRELLEG